MTPDDFQFDLPPELIAQEPLAERSASRLLDASDSALVDRQFTDVTDILREGDLLVLNDTRVLPARLFATKPSGGRVEILLERVRDNGEVLAQLKSNRTPAEGTVLNLEGGGEAVLEGREEPFFVLRFAEPAEAYFDAHGHMPLPPYIQRPDADADRDRYQTVFARETGAVAAPTAGLHFDTALLEQLAAMGVETGTVTLHVGAGTYRPLRPEQIESGRLHAERYAVGAELVSQVEQTRARGGRVVAVGTTVVRSLESASLDGALRPASGETQLFIREGFDFHTTDAMITNFHLPGSSLLMLVSAFAGFDRISKAYAHAVAGGYRFFSYGDAMFLERS